MILAYVLFIIATANTWLAWMLGSWLGVSAWFIFIPISILLMIGGGLALGLISTLFGTRDKRSNWKRFGVGFLKGWGWLVCVFWLLPWGLFAIVQITNSYFPASLPRVTITNGDKTVVFQSMMHIASPGFYEDVKKDMENLKGQDYVYLYEGVKAGTPESVKRLSELMGTDVSPEMYDMIAQIGGLVTQDQTFFMGILPGINADITTDDIVALAEKASLPVPSTPAQGIIDEVKKTYPTLTPFQKMVSEVMARAAMNILLRSYTQPELATNLNTQVPVFQIILDKRNEHLVDTILATPSHHLYIQYGAMHYAGVLKLLHDKDARWHEVARTELEVIR